MGIWPRDKDLRTAAVALVSESSASVYKDLSKSYQTGADGGVDGGIKAPGVLSIFNAFNIFRYSKFGLNTETYNSDAHFDAPLDAPPKDSIAFTSLAAFNSNSAIIENPTASAIIEWARKFGTSEANNYQTPTPYSSSDFLWCTYYGKVPNNRLVTLRRYPVPVEDNIANVSKELSPLIPLAQAVTWYGKDIDNDLSKILNIKWGFEWTSRKADVKDIQGTEIPVDTLLQELGVTKEKNPILYDSVKTTLFGTGDSIGMAELTGYDAKMNGYISEAYGPDGPYWNRILGPVNVIDRTLIRERGFDYMTDIELKFNYSLRSYGNINPKIAFLDLLTNFLSLTYNSAPFWGGAVRYFAKTGLKLSPLGMEEDILKSDMPGALNKGIEALTAQIKTNLDKYKGIIDEAFKAIQNPKSAIEVKKDAESKIKNYTGVKEDMGDIASKLLAGKVGKFMQSPLSYRSILDGRAIGEWHITIGNPMNPMAMIGNLVVSSVDMTVGETLGLDDFPTEFIFKITLKHGRPRAKQDIESMFNFGNGFMSTNALAPPSSAMNSLGEYNTDKSKALDGMTKAKANKDALDPLLAQDTGAGTYSNTMPEGTRGNVTRMYGSTYGNSLSLPKYFENHVTKD